MKRKRKTKCKKCKYFVGGGEINGGYGLCVRPEYTFRSYPSVHETDFCSRGERKTEKMTKVTIIVNDEKKNGRWINHTEYGVTTYITDKDVECSECGHRQPKLFDMNYCPNCGADMRERKETNE